MCLHLYIYINVLTTGIGNAYGVLSDSEKRRRYDQYGENLGPSRSHRHRNSYEDEFEGKY